MRIWKWSIPLMLAMAGLNGDPVTEFHSGACLLVVRVPVEGLLKFAGHAHLIEAGELEAELRWNSTGAIPTKLDLEVPVGSLQVMDREIEIEEREKVRQEMRSKRVLGMEEWKQITFQSTAIEVRDPSLWVVAGELNIRGQSRATEIIAKIDNYPDGRLRARGVVRLQLADFGIKPVTAVGGMLRTADFVEVSFDFIGQHPAAGMADESTDPINNPGK